MGSKLGACGGMEHVMSLLVWRRLPVGIDHVSDTGPVGRILLQLRPSSHWPTGAFSSIIVIWNTK